ncbi:membrane protein [Arthrobacter phage Aoka]|nr:membrane protein [Arthrobacter phage Aoka]
MNTRHYRLAPVIAVGFLGCILAANVVTTHLGMVPVGFGLVATAGTYFAGLTFILRDALQDTAGKRWTIAVIALGAALSFLVADPFIALASAAAFGLAELADLAIYTPLRKHGYLRAAIASNIAGAFVDTAVFLWIAGFPIAAAMPGQMVGKLLVTALAVSAVVLVRAKRQAMAAA